MLYPEIPVTTVLADSTLTLLLFRFVVGVSTWYLVSRNLQNSRPSFAGTQIHVDHASLCGRGLLTCEDFAHGRPNSTRILACRYAQLHLRAGSHWDCCWTVDNSEAYPLGGNRVTLFVRAFEQRFHELHRHF